MLRHSRLPDPGSILKIKWLRMKIVSDTPVAELLPAHDDAHSEVIHLSLSNEKGLLGVVLANGAAALIQLGDKVRNS